MKKVLALSLRPKSLDSLWGQATIRDAIRNQVKSGRVPSAWMLVGQTGSGKTTAARIIARALNCPHMPAKKFGAYCLQCKPTKHLLNIAEVNAAKYTGIEDIEKLISSADYAPVPPSLKRVYILDEAQMLSRNAQNMLNKTFEDTPDSTAWIIATTDPHKIIPALAGRCTAATYALIPLRGKTAEEFIVWAAKKAGIVRPLDDFFDFIHKNGVTSARNILGALERYGAGIDPDRAIANKSDVDTLAICKNLISGEWAGVKPQLDRAVPEDGEFILGSVVGFLRGILLSKSASVPRKLAAMAIEDFATVNWLAGENVKWSLLVAKLFKWTQIFPEGKPPRR